VPRGERGSSARCRAGAGNAGLRRQPPAVRAAGQERQGQPRRALDPTARWRRHRPWRRPSSPPCWPETSRCPRGAPPTPSSASNSRRRWRPRICWA